jgi:16S rRNA processing protein RimM
VEANDSPRVTLARLVRPHGLRGEVAAEILTDFPERLLRLKNADLWDGRTPPRRVAIRKCWLSQSHGGQAVFHFEGSDSIDDAKRLVGLQVQIPLADRMPLGSGQYYVTDLIGCEVWEERGVLIGRVKDVATTGTSVLEVETSEGELLVPLAEEICVRIDTATRRIDVRLPEGLRELNRKS